MPKLNLYRNKTDGSLKTKEQLIKENPNTSFSLRWTENTLSFLNVEQVYTSSSSLTPTIYQTIINDGVEKTSDGVWEEKWKIVDLYADIKDSDGNVTKTKAKQEEELDATIKAGIANEQRQKRQKLLEETDFCALSDVTLSEAMKSYRQKLRDLPKDLASKWPNLDESDWPTKP